MVGDDANGVMGAFSGMSHFGKVVGGLATAATMVGGLAIWGADKTRQIDLSEKKTFEIQQQVEILKSELNKLELTLKSIPAESSGIGPAGVPGPVGPPGPRGEKGERGESGEPGESAASADAATVRAIIVEELRKLPASGGAEATGVAMAEVNSDCTVLRPTEDKFRLVFKKGMTFCAPDGELIMEVRRVRDDDFQNIQFTVPGASGWTCSVGNKCQLDWLRNYSFHIERMDRSGTEPQAITVFKKES